jgi:outer membrane protein OmpA-like peptidoglycan-associated protein
MIGMGRGLTAAALTAALLASACHRATPVSKAAAATFPFHRKKPALPKPSPTAHLIQLPDSAIFVERGSTEEALAAFLASKDPAPRSFRFPATEFEPWQSKPNDATLRTMYAVAQILRAYPHSEVTLIGHTDNVGPADRNLALSQERVDRMARLLIHAGIAPRRITAIGHGMRDPIADNRTDEGKARNRRIELVVTAK